MKQALANYANIFLASISSINFPSPQQQVCSQPLVQLLVAAMAFGR
jgi:hypothetical protein